VYRSPKSVFIPAYSITNKGVLFDQFKHLFKIKTEDSRIRYTIPLGSRQKNDAITDFALQLRKVGPNVFVRHGGLLRIDRSKRDMCVRISRLNFYVSLDAQEFNEAPLVKNPEGIHFSKNEKIYVYEVIPESHWDETNQMFFTPSEDKDLILAASCFILDGESSVQMIVCIDLRKEWPTYRILVPEKIPEYKEQSSWLFRHKQISHDVTWNDAKTDLGIKSPCLVDVDEGQLRISLSLRKRVVSSISENEVYCLDFDCEPSADNSGNESSPREDTDEEEPLSVYNRNASPHQDTDEEESLSIYNRNASPCEDTDEEEPLGVYNRNASPCEDTDEEEPLGVYNRNASPREDTH
jgi:hypothetical protein